MAERTSGKILTQDELIVEKLKETFDRNGNILTEPNNSDVWLMAAVKISYDVNLHKPPFQPSDNLTPTHHIRLVLRTADAQSGSNPYVDGSDFYLVVDEQNQTVDFVWEEECFSDSPLFHGGEIPSALNWLKELAEPLLHECFNNPFLTANMTYALRPNTWKIPELGVTHSRIE